MKKQKKNDVDVGEFLEAVEKGTHFLLVFNEDKTISASHGDNIEIAQLILALESIKIRLLK